MASQLVDLPPGWTQSVWLARGGREAIVVASPEPSDLFAYASVDGGGGGGEVISAGETLGLSLFVSSGSELRFRVSCEDGLDIGFRVSSVRRGPQEPQADLHPYDRMMELEETKMCFTQDSDVLLEFDNSYSWFYPKTIHVRVEVQLPRPAVPPPTPSQRKKEEGELRELWNSQLAHEEARISQRISKLRAQLGQAEAELRRLRLVRQAAAPLAAPRSAEECEDAIGPIDAQLHSSDRPRASCSPTSKAESATSSHHTLSTPCEASASASESPRGTGVASEAREFDELMQDPARMVKERRRLVLEHLRELRLLLSRVDREATIRATWESASEDASTVGSYLLIRELSLNGHTLQDIGRFGASADLDHILALSLRDLASRARQEPSLNAEQIGGANRGNVGVHEPSSNVATAETHLEEPTSLAKLAEKSRRELALSSSTLSCESCSDVDDGCTEIELRAEGETAGMTLEDGHTAITQLQLLSQLLLQLDPQATMQVTRLSDEEFDVSSINIGGQTLQDVGVVTAETNVGHILLVCKHITNHTK
ncbi:MAG: hypothetical protein SGPRY_001315 [Prymnesium sp.]